MTPMPKVIIIAALAASTRIIGSQGKLPWSIPEDLQRFRQLTQHHTVIMGRKTWEFDIQQRPLRQRMNIIVTSQSSISHLQPICENEAIGVQFVRSLPQALDQATTEKIFIIGGASIYAQALDFADRLELTIVEGDYEGDVFFPEYGDRGFQLIKTDFREGYRFETYDRIVEQLTQRTANLNQNSI